MKKLWIAVAGATVAAQGETFTGTITDTMCGAKHEMMKNQPDDQCIKMCTKGQYTYALFDGKRDQAQRPENISKVRGEKGQNERHARSEDEHH